MAYFPRTCVYAGTFDLPVRTYTTTWAPIFGQTWDFNKNSPEPMEFRGFINGALGTGMWARILDINAGVSEFKYGDVAQADEQTANFRYPCYQNNQIMGWFSAQHPNDLIAYPYSYPAVIGLSRTSTGPFGFAGYIQLPTGVSNTQFPAPYGPQNQPGVNNTVAYSSLVNLNAHTYLWPGLLDNTPNLDLSGSTNAIGCSLAYGGFVYSTTVNGSSPTQANRLMQTDWQTFGNHFTMAWTNPPGTEDINADIINSASDFWSSTYNGFIFCFKDKGNIIEGKPTPYGFAVVMWPDGSRYYILRFVPADATAATLLNAVGQIYAKTDKSGGVWFKNTNSQTTLLVSAGSVLKILPLFYPVGIPDSVDTDPTVTLMRSLQK